MKTTKIAKKIGLNPQHFGKIYKKMCEYAPFDFNFWENRKNRENKGYKGWTVEETGEVVYGNYYLVGNLMRTGNGRLFLSGDEIDSDDDSSTIIFNS